MAVTILDRIIAHQVKLERAKAGEVKTIRNLLSSLDQRIIDVLSNLPENYTQRQLNNALLQIKVLSEIFYTTDMVDALEKVARSTVSIEIPFTTETVDTYLNPDGTAVNRPRNRDVLEQGFSQKYEGKTLQTWTNLLGVDKSNRIQKAVRTAAVDRGDLVQVAKQQIRNANNNADTVTRAHVNQFSNVSRDSVYEGNDDKVTTIVWSTILDSRSTVTCGARSNQKYDSKTKEPIDHDNDWGGGPGRIHWNCRSVGIPTDDDGVITSGPVAGHKFTSGTKTAIGAEKGYERGGNETVVGTVAKIPTDNNQLEKELISGHTNYETWLRTQPKAFVEDTLGVGKAELFVNQKVSLQSFVVEDGRELTLEQMIANQ